jgi:CDP-diacylglycerol--glycerol-3-phosphate 3-phosphatidyltransferase
MLSNQRSLIEPFFQPLIKNLATVNPNLLTALGSIPPILFFVFMVYHWYILALIALPGSFFDMLDGMVAKKYHKVTSFGGFFDSTVDRIADFLIITSFAFAGIVPWTVVAPLLLFAYLTSYIRSRGELANPKVSFAMGLIERSERLVLIFITLLLYALFPTINFSGLTIAGIIFLFLTLLSLYTVIQRVTHAYKYL